jgi:hypothetical protein
MWNKWGVEVVQQNISDDEDLFFFQKDIYIKKNYTSNFLRSFSEMMRSCKCFHHANKIPNVKYIWMSNAVAKNI